MRKIIGIHIHFKGILLKISRQFFTSKSSENFKKMHLQFAKKRKLSSNWIITNSEETDLNIIDKNGYTIYETDAAVVAVVNKNDHTAVKGQRKNIYKEKFKKFKEIESKQCEVKHFDKNENMKMEVSDNIQNSEQENMSSLFVCKSPVPEPRKERNLPSRVIEKDLDLLQKKNNLSNKSLPCGGVKFYKTEHDSAYIVQLPCYDKLTFQGKLQISLISGEIEVFGYIVNNSSKNKTLDVFSPKRCMQLSIFSKLPSSVLSKSDIKTNLSNKVKINEDEVNKIINSLGANDTLLVANKLVCTSSFIFNYYCHEIDIYFEKQIVETGSEKEKDLGCLLHSDFLYEKKAFTQGEGWKNIETKKCAVVCGGKGVGKSILLKYLINLKLPELGSVLCLDFDPGQTEFTAPGCVSAVLIEKPLLGPNFTHIKQPEKMVFLGFVNVALDPVRYIKSVNYIVESCKNDPSLSKLPWFVNTMGFNKGVGLDIMVNILKLLQPDCVIQINSSDKSKNYVTQLTSEAVQSLSVISFLPVKDTLDYVHISKNSCSRLKGIGFQIGFRPSELRELMTLSYFSKLVFFPYYNLNAVKPRWIKLELIYLATNEMMEPKHILKAFNGSLVGLCNIDGISCRERLITEDPELHLCKIAIMPEAAPCIGQGIVRGIDYEERKIYILTPLSDDELKMVNCLNIGKMGPPPSLYLKQGFVDTSTVYTDFTGTRNIQSLKRTFKYVPQLQTEDKERK